MANEILKKKSRRDMGVGCLDTGRTVSAAYAAKQCRIREAVLPGDTPFLHQCMITGKPATEEKEDLQKALTQHFYQTILACGFIKCFVLLQHQAPVSQANVSQARKSAIFLDYYALEGDYLLEITWTRETEEPDNARNIFRIWVQLLFSFMKELKRLIIRSDLYEKITAETAAQTGFEAEPSYWKNTREEHLYTCSRTMYYQASAHPAETISFTKNYTAM